MTDKVICEKAKSGMCDGKISRMDCEHSTSHLPLHTPSGYLCSARRLKCGSKGLCKCVPVEGEEKHNAKRK